MCEREELSQITNGSFLSIRERGVPRNGVSIHLLSWCAAQQSGYPPHAALLSGNPFSRMLSQETLDVCLELSFHFGFSVLKTTSAYL
jgi:hypothetical protein